MPTVAVRSNPRFPVPALRLERIRRRGHEVDHGPNQDTPPLTHLPPELGGWREPAETSLLCHLRLPDDDGLAGGRARFLAGMSDSGGRAPDRPNFAVRAESLAASWPCQGSGSLRAG